MYVVLWWEQTVEIPAICRLLRDLSTYSIHLDVQTGINYVHTEVPLVATVLLLAFSLVAMVTELALS